MTRGFDDRRDWASTMHREWLEPAMAAYWDVSPAAIQPMFSDAADAITADAAGGIDAIVQTRGAAPVFVAQRVRTMRAFRGSCYRPDFSLREQTSTGDASEFVRLMDAYRTGRDLPSCYLFGIGVATSRRACVDGGLADRYPRDDGVDRRGAARRRTPSQRYRGTNAILSHRGAASV
jgi:hypothetical protein